VDAIANFNDGTSALDVTNCLVWRTFYNVRVDRVRVDGVNTWTNDTCYVDLSCLPRYKP
jgi:hypothetical protein